MRGWRALAIALAAALLLTGSVLAQRGTPEADTTENPRLVDPSECTVQPRPGDEIANILQLTGSTAIPEPERITISPPLGQIADPATTISIKETARQVLACFNAGDIPRAAALMTDNGIKRAYWGLTINPESRKAASDLIAGTPVPRQTDVLVRLIAVTDTSFLPDGRVAAFVILNEPLLPPAGPETLLFIFKNVDGHWLVDDWVDFTIVPANFGTATPTSSS
jgi:hypothetical protein